MRKVKNINGYYVVQFNAKERTERPWLGSHGVIHSDFYTGDISIDFGSFELDISDSLSEAVAFASDL